MKYRTLFCIAGSLLAVTASSSAAFIENFSGLNSNEALVPTGTGPGYNGWTQTEANYVDPAAPTDPYPLAWGQTVVADNGVAVGGWSSTPEADSFYIQHTVGIPLIGGSVGMTFTVGRDPLIDNIQNTFEIGAYNGGGSNLFSFGLEPTAGNVDAWDMYYTSGGGGRNYLSLGNIAVTLNQVTDMDLTFTQSGLDADFALALTTLSGTLNYNGTLTGLAGENVDSLRISMLKVPGTVVADDPFAAYGTNFVAVANIAVIPEPGSLTLLGLTVGVSLLGRRRRA